MKNKILIVIIILLIIGNVIGIYYFISYKDLKKEINEKNNIKVEEKEPPVVEAIDERYQSKKIYKSYKSISYDEDDVQISFELILYEDHTYLFGRSGYGAHMTQGTYKIKDNKIILSEKIVYGSDACYYISKEVEETVLTINNDKSVTYINDSWGKHYMDEKDASELETISFYLRNHEEFIDCTEE